MGGGRDSSSCIGVAGGGTTGRLKGDVVSECVGQAWCGGSALAWIRGGDAAAATCCVAAVVVVTADDVVGVRCMGGSWGYAERLDRIVSFSH